MKIIIAAFIGVISCGAVGYGESEVWPKLNELLKQDGTLEGKRRIEAYRYSLSRPQILQATREFCEKNKDCSPRQWGEEKSFELFMVLGVYGGFEDKFDDVAVKTFLGCIGNENEGLVFRRELLRELFRRWHQLSPQSKKECRQQMFMWLTNKATPRQLRQVLCREMADATAEDYNKIISGDKNVREFRKKNPSKRASFKKLVGAGEIKLESVSVVALSDLRKDVELLLTTLSSITKDDQETKEFKEVAQYGVTRLDELTMPPEMQQKGAQQNGTGVIGGTAPRSSLPKQETTTR